MMDSEIRSRHPKKDEAVIETNKDDESVHVDQLVSAAILFFKEAFNIDIDQSGKLVNEPSDDQLNALRQWHENTSSDSIIMHDVKIFIFKLVLANALMPQISDDGNINYLFGKGVGVEIALQGFVSGREKKAKTVPYRTHSDFEIYAVADDTYEVIPNSKRFIAVFGAQEIFPVHQTKGLNRLPPDLLHKTSEKVVIGGISFLIPRLEILFIDKFEKGNEPVERRLRDNTDAELLATTYDLDWDVAHQLIDQYVIDAVLSDLETVEITAQKNSEIIPIKIFNAKDRIVSEHPDTSEDDIDEKLQDDFILQQFLKNTGVTLSDIYDTSTHNVIENITKKLIELEIKKRSIMKDKLQQKHQQIDFIRAIS